MNNNIVLDSSALLALIQEEQGSEVIRPLLNFIIMSTVNVAESLIVLQRINIDPKEGLSLITDTVSTIAPFNIEHAEHVAQLYPHVKNKGISLGDCACISLGIKLQVPIYTADKIWARLNLKHADIRLIR